MGHMIAAELGYQTIGDNAREGWVNFEKYLKLFLGVLIGQSQPVPIGDRLSKVVKPLV